MATSARPRQHHVAQPPDKDCTNVIKTKDKSKPATFPRQNMESYNPSPQMTHSLSLDVLMERLSTSIKAGDKDRAISIVGELADRRVPVNMSIADDKAPDEEKVR